MKKNKLRFPLVLLVLFVIVISGLYVINPGGTNTLDPRARIFGYVPYRVPASSMAPTILRGDYIIASTYAYASRDPKQREIITFKFPKNTSQVYVKRIIGVPGDTVEINGDRVFVNREELNERYTQHVNTSTVTSKARNWVVPDSNFFVMGDNRDNSADSRHWGFVPRDHVIARAEYVWMSAHDNTGPIRHGH